MAKRRVRGVVVFVAALAVALAACSNDTKSTSGGGSSATSIPKVGATSFSNLKKVAAPSPCTNEAGVSAGEIKVGDRISVQTQNQTTATTGTINSFQYLETGILLAVTPRINSGGMVRIRTPT